MDDLNDPLVFAQKYSELPLSGYNGIELRDIPTIIKQHANGGKTLDYGCGAGQITLYLKSLGLDVEAVDINKYMIEIAQKKDPSGNYKIISSAEIPKGDNYYDLVYAGWVLVHVASKQELVKICKEIARVLKPGGTFLALVNSEDTYGNDWVTTDYKFEENRNLTSGSITKTVFKDNDLVLYCYYWTEEDYCEVLREAGLTVVRIHKPIESDGDCYNKAINRKEKSVISIYVAQKL